MRITGSDLALAQEHTSVFRHERQERLEKWVGTRPARRPEEVTAGAASDRMASASAGGPQDAKANAYQTGRLAKMAKALGRAAQSLQVSSQAPAKPATTDSTSGGSDPSQQVDPKTKKILQILEKLFGIKGVTSLDLQIDTSKTTLKASEAAVAYQQGSSPQGWGLSYDYHESTLDYERSTLNATGTITLADGRAFHLDLAFTQERLYQTSTDISVRAGDAQKVDPLALDLGGQGMSFSPKTTRLDLDGDGNQESVHQLAGKARWLTLDRNGDGTITREDLFGPQTGDGFAELAKLDDDRNGWIDGGDRMFNQLRLWDGSTKTTGAAKDFTSLAQAGVGAISLSSIAASFRYADASNTTMATNRSSSVFLRDDGSAGRVNQVDLVV